MIEKYQKQVGGLRVAQMILDFNSDMRAAYGGSGVLVGVGPMQTFLGWCVSKGYIALAPYPAMLGNFDTDISVPAIEGLIIQHEARLSAWRALKGTLSGLFSFERQRPTAELHNATARTLRALMCRVRVLEAEADQNTAKVVKIVGELAQRYDGFMIQTYNDGLKGMKITNTTTGEETVFGMSEAK